MMKELMSNSIIYRNREEAELVLTHLKVIVDKFAVASVEDLHDLIGLPSTHEDHKWGWTALDNIEIHQVEEGYVIDLPPVESI